MPIIPSVPMSVAPAPTHHKPYPWRFSLDEYVHVLGQPPQFTFRVTGGELWIGWPHLHLQDAAGTTWRVPQIHCSTKPITFRKG